MPPHTKGNEQLLGNRPELRTFRHNGVHVQPLHAITERNRRNTSLRQCYKKYEQEMKREYDQHVREMSMDPSHP